MLYRTHAAGGFLAGFLLTGNLGCGAVAAVSALLPDVESPKSFVGRKLPGVSHAGEMVFGHRQAFHSLLAAAGFLAVAYVISASVHLSYCYAFSGFIGYVSHLILDTLNPAGIPWLWPLKFRLRIPLTQTGGIMERAILFPVLVLFGLLLIGREFSLFLFGRKIYSTLVQAAKGMFRI